MPTCHSWKTSLEHWKWRPYKVRSLVSNSIYAKKDRNGPSSANQVASTHEPRHSHAVCTLWVHPPTSPYPTLSAKAEPISKGHYRKWHHEAKSLVMDISIMGLKSFKRWKSGWSPGMMFCPLYSIWFTVVSSPRIALIKVGYGLLHVQ